MKTIAVLSDTHGNYSAIDAILPILKECDFVFHLGDCASDMKAYEKEIGEKLYTVNGNCDFIAANKWKAVEVEGKKILLTHGDIFGVKSSLTQLSLFAEEQGCDAVFFGHTHQAFCETEKGIIYINPGAMSRGCYDKSFAFVTVVDGKILCNHNRNALAGK